VLCAWIDGGDPTAAPAAGPAEAIVHNPGPWRPKTTPCKALKKSEVSGALHTAVGRGHSDTYGEGCSWFGLRHSNGSSFAISVSWYPTTADAASDFKAQNCTPGRHRIHALGARAFACQQSGLSKLYVLDGHLWLYLELIDPKMGKPAQLRALRSLTSKALARLGH
jgi:hypothetical protein